MAFYRVPVLIIRTTMVLLILAGLGWWWTGPSSDELVVYSARCTNGRTILPVSLATRLESLESFEQDLKKYQADRANCQILALNRTVYKLNKARGEVYYTGLFGPRRLIDCSIFRRTEWACSYTDGSGKVVIIDGLRAIHADGVKHPTLMNFSLRRWQWWAVTLYWWVGRPRGAWLIPEQHEYF